MITPETIQRALAAIKRVALETRCKHPNASLDFKEGIVWFTCPDCPWNWGAHPEQVEEWAEKAKSYFQ